MALFSRKRRPMHLGSFPMEKIRRVDKPTTLITDNVRQVPKRAGFFVRAFYGDIGERAGDEIKRFITKNPLNAALGRIHWRQVPLHRGKPAPGKAPIPDDPVKLTEHIKALCHFLDADMVGICEMPDYAWFSHDMEGEPITTRHKYAVVVVIDQGFDTFEGSSGDDWISGAQSYRAYLKGSTITTTVADYIRRLGYEAQSHSNADGDVLQIPLMLLAGLGELSRIGELILNPFLGPRHKTAVITTDLPLVPDKPIDFNLQNFCDTCMKCARECPAQAIPYGDKVLYNGYEIWKPDVGKCVTYRVTNQKGSACGRCMKMCPWNKEGLMHHRLAMWLAIKWKWTHKPLIWLDDALGYGIRNPIKRWWLDLERIGDEVVAPPAGSNEGDLHLDRGKQRTRRPLAVYPPERHPAGDEKKTVPLDRRQGLVDAEIAARDLKALKETLKPNKNAP
ncbi:MAG: reductive dehalogenase [Alphaproteobacteria bacterium]|nr:reductive dehalogenase [Alphaproteobacteria bacterium]